jgi:hypothetical protein
MSAELDEILARCTTENERALARELLAFHREGLAALVALVKDDARIAGQIDRDPRVSSLLALHGVHPVPAEVRVARALPPDVELVAIEDGVPCLRAASTGDRGRLAAAIDQALCGAAPELEPARIEWLDAPHVPIGRLVPVRDAHESACDRCGAALERDHAHALGGDRALVCLCLPCTSAPGLRVIAPRAEPIDLGADEWRGVPVDLAFFYRDGGEIVAAYPGPAGVVRGELAAEARALRETVARLEPDVEAVLVRRDRSQASAHRVSIDVCHRLVALIRREWRGFGGGPSVRAELDRFFEALPRAVAR